MIRLEELTRGASVKGILPVVEVEADKAKSPVYIRRPFQKEPDFGVTSVNYALKELLARVDRPSPQAGAPE